MKQYVIIDLEMCNVPRQNKKDFFALRNEIIEIGAVLLGDDYAIADTFKTYVAPQYGEIDSYIEKLTGISQNDTKDAPMIYEALCTFLEWLPQEAVIVSWSDNDARQIQRELEYKNLLLPEMERYLATWEDCQKTFGEKMNSSKTYGLSEALIIAGIEYDENIHDALVDAKNTALLFAKMQNEEELQLISYLADEGKNDVIDSPFADFLKDFSCDA